MNSVNKSIEVNVCTHPRPSPESCQGPASGYGGRVVLSLRVSGVMSLGVSAVMSLRVSGVGQSCPRGGVGVVAGALG